MSLINNDTKEYLEDAYDEYPIIRYMLYGRGIIVGLWILGKASLLLADSIKNFKNLHNAIKQ